MLRTLLTTVALGISLASCTSGPPPGFVGGTGNHWSFPLVGSLEDDLLITPVTIDGRGPFLFALDPDANVSIVDEQLVKEVGLRTRKGPHRLDETDTQHPRFYAEVLALEIGNLIVERRDAMIVKTGTFDAIGRRIHGVLGKDVLADSLVFGFDREQGLAYLTTVKAFKPPPDAIPVKYQLVRSMIQNAEVVPLGRRLANAMIGGEQFSMHLDLGAQASQLRASAWERAKLVPREGTTSVIDEVGTRRGVAKLGVAEAVTLGGASAAKVAFVPYDDKRWSDQELDGTLGLDFFRAYSVWINWDAKTYYLAKRRPVAPATRADRWDVGALGKCKQLGCVSARLVDPLAGKPADPTKPHPGVVLAVTREDQAGGMELEVVLEATGRPELPRLVVNMGPTADRVMQHLKSEWVGVTLTVVDASPFPRACPGTVAGCVDLLAR
jgi:hypothetical protein